MSRSHELVKKIIADRKYKVLEDDGENVVIKYQINVIHFFLSSEDDSFVSVLLPGLDNVTDDNYAEVVMKCHKLNEDMKQIKLYTVNDMVLVASEFFYMEEKDLAFQISKSLDGLISAKVSYRKL